MMVFPWSEWIVNVDTNQNRGATNGSQGTQTREGGWINPTDIFSNVVWYINVVYLSPSFFFFLFLFFSLIFILACFLDTFSI